MNFCEFRNKKAFSLFYLIILNGLPIKHLWISVNFEIRRLSVCSMYLIILNYGLPIKLQIRGFHKATIDSIIILLLFIFASIFYPISLRTHEQKFRLSRYFYNVIVDATIQIDVSCLYLWYSVSGAESKSSRWKISSSEKQKILSSEK